MIGDHAFAPEMEAQITGFDEQARVKLAITSSAPPGAESYRLGCPRPGFLSPDEMRIRWFPAPTHRRPCIFRLNEYEDPKVPYPGPYVIAYFDGRNLPCCTPQLKIYIPFWQPMMRWFHGDLSLTLNTKSRL